MKHGAHDYENLICNVLKSYKLDIRNCWSQGCDGASVMSGAYSGVQQRISYAVSNALYLHTLLHILP